MDNISRQNSLIITNFFIQSDSNQWSLNRLAVPKLDSVLSDTSKNYKLTVFSVTPKQYQYFYLSSEPQKAKIKLTEDYLAETGLSTDTGLDRKIWVIRDEYSYSGNEFPKDSFHLFLKSIFVRISIKKR